MRIDLNGKAALVTGGATGIGRGVALALAQAGADVALTYRSHDGAQVAKEIGALGRRSAAYALDATDSAQIDQWSTGPPPISAARSTFSSTMPAGCSPALPIVGDVRRALAPGDRRQPVQCVRRAPARCCGRCRTVAGSSTSPRVAGRNGGGRARPPTGVEGGHARADPGPAKEVGPRGITVNAVAPGLILDTPFHEEFTPPSEQQAAIDSTPLRSAGFPDDWREPCSTWPRTSDRSAPARSSTSTAVRTSADQRYDVSCRRLALIRRGFCHGPAMRVMGFRVSIVDDMTECGVPRGRHVLEDALERGRRAEHALQLPLGHLVHAGLEVLAVQPSRHVKVLLHRLTARSGSRSWIACRCSRAAAVRPGAPAGRTGCAASARTSGW